MGTFSDLLGHKISRIILIYIGFFALAFMIFAWTFPVIGPKTIGNDYTAYWVNQQLFQQFSLHHGTFPLYAPGVSNGWTNSALTLGQIWHPNSWIAPHVPGYWKGEAIEIGTLLRILSLGICNAVLFFTLRRLKINPLLSFVISVITVYNLRMLDCFRYGSSLENYLGGLLLCCGLIWLFVSDKKKRMFLFVAVSTWLTIVGGHPQFMFFMLVSNAILCLTLPFVLAEILPDEKTLSAKRTFVFYGQAALAVLAGAGMGAMYLLPYKFEYMAENVRQIGFGFDWACGYSDDMSGLLCNFFNPFYSDVHGAFGTSGILLMFFILPLSFLITRRISWGLLILWGLGLLCLGLSVGDHLSLYKLFWQYIPFAKSFRIPGRLTVFMPLVVFVTFAWLAAQKPKIFTIKRKAIQVSPVAFLGITGLIGFLALSLLDPVWLHLTADSATYSPAIMHQKNMFAGTPLLFCALSIITFICLIVSGTKRKYIRYLVLATLVLTLGIQLHLLTRYGTFIANKTRTSDLANYKIITDNRQYPHCSGVRRLDMTRHIQQTCGEPQLARLCPYVINSKDKNMTYQMLLTQRNAGVAIIENAEDFDNTHPIKKGHIDLTYNTYNTMKYEVNCDNACVFATSYPFSKRWKAYVNDQPVQTYRCNAMETAVMLSKGQHLVEFKYFSFWTFLGLAIALVTVGGIAAYFIFTTRQTLKYKLSAQLIASVVLVGIFGLWTNSVYGGRSLGAEYAWTLEDLTFNQSSQINLAYGKHAMMSGYRLLYPYHWVATMANDGQRNPELFCYCERADIQNYWMVDLVKQADLAQIHIYMPAKDSTTYPLEVFVSRDQKNFQKVALLQKRENTSAPYKINLPNINARYVMLRTQGKGRLALSEVEVYACPTQTK